MTEPYLALLAERDALASELAALREGVVPGPGEAVERLAAKAAEVAGVSAVGYGEALDALMRAAGYVPKSERALSPLVQLKRDARKRLAADNDRLRAELAGLRVELERTEGDWAAAIREATRARAAVARVEAIHVLVQCPTSEHFYCSGECDRAGEGGLRDLCDLCDRWWPCPTIAALSVAATDTEETP